MTEWRDDQPIFKQLANKVSEQILNGIWPEQQALPSVRVVAADLKINHLTVMKSYQLLVDEGLVEKRRGQGMFVKQGAVSQLKNTAYQAFVDEQLPQIAKTLTDLDISIDEFIKQLQPHMKEKS